MTYQINFFILLSSILSTLIILIDSLFYIISIIRSIVILFLTCSGSFTILISFSRIRSITIISLFSSRIIVLSSYSLIILFLIVLIDSVV